MKLKIIFTIFLFALSQAGFIYAVETTGVVVTIKPLHSLVQGVIGDTGQAQLIVTGSASPHGFQLKPSQVKSMQEAKVVFYIDDAFEFFLHNALEILPDFVRKIALADRAGITLLERRSGGAWEAHEYHAHEQEAHGAQHDDHGDYDLHVWLDTENAKKMVQTITEALSARYPENRDTYEGNARTLMERIDALGVELESELVDVKTKPFIVFHDAYQYFERRYGLTGVGAITLELNEALSVKRIQEIRSKIETTGAVCLFGEPSFPDKLGQIVTEGLRRGTLDPLGVGLEAGPDLYFNLLKQLAQNLKHCLQ